MEKFEWKEDKVYEGIEPLIYLTANKFYMTAKGLDNYFTEPIIVNLAFSVELYLKCLNTKTTLSKKANTNLATLTRKTIHGHPFDKIFEKLKPIDKVNLSAKYLRKYDRDFKNDLCKLKNAFVDWRYSFEKDLVICEGLLHQIADFLKDYIENEMKQGKYSR
ncbi:MAG: hypothetical protein MK086_09200 [Flavobacteriales bacterium]|nr:hypothetical protein [Flavobacteriales bacterium]